MTVSEKEWRPLIMSASEALEAMQRNGDGKDDDAMIFITEDMRLKDGQLDDTDRLIFEQMRTGKVVPLFDEQDRTLHPALRDLQDNSESIQDAARRRTAAFRDEMTDRQAEMVRMWRVVERGSWRYVARHASEAWGGE